MRSLPDTSARLPAETKLDRPRPRPTMSARFETPRAPDWQKNATRPRLGISGDRVAFSEMPGAVLITPRQLGPITRIPYDLASPTRWRCRLRPSSPSSPNPLD